MISQTSPHPFIHLTVVDVDGDDDGVDDDSDDDDDDYDCLRQI